jgi:hypothetical protein
MEFMKWLVRGTFLLGSGVGCSLLSVPVSNISSNTFPGGLTWRT